MTYQVSQGRDNISSDILDCLVQREALGNKAINGVIAALLRGELSPEWLSAFLMGVACRGIYEDELLVIVRILRQHIKPIVEEPIDAIDVCGTGGDKQQTLNVSTAVALVLAAMGVPCAKHGGRASSSQSGARDVLEALSIPQWDDIPKIKQRFTRDNIAFVTASLGASYTSLVPRVRKILGMPTLFNLLGPLLNPLKVTYQMVGVYTPHYLEMMANILCALGVKKVWSVCGISSYGEGFIDELTLSGENEIFAVEYGTHLRYRVDPEMFGFLPAPISKIRGGDSAYNAAAIEDLADGSHGAYRDTVIMNAAIALHVSGRQQILDARSGKIDRMALKENVAAVAYALDKGVLRDFLTRLRLSLKVNETG